MSYKNAFQSYDDDFCTSEVAKVVCSNLLLGSGIEDRFFLHPSSDYCVYIKATEFSVKVSLRKNRSLIKIFDADHPVVWGPLKGFNAKSNSSIPTYRDMIIENLERNGESSKIIHSLLSSPDPSLSKMLKYMSTKRTHAKRSQSPRLPRHSYAKLDSPHKSAKPEVRPPIVNLSAACEKGVSSFPGPKTEIKEEYVERDQPPLSIKIEIDERADPFTYNASPSHSPTSSYGPTSPSYSPTSPCRSPPPFVLPCGRFMKTEPKF
jgi:hypothetical protein